MKPIELLGAKEVVSAVPAKIGLTISVQASQSSWRARFSMKTETFAFLFSPLESALGPKVEIIGDGATGFAISLTKNQGLTLTPGTRTTAFTSTARLLNLVESRVEMVSITGLLIETNDGLHYFVTGPLQPRLLSSTVRNARLQLGTKEPGMPVHKIFQKAYKVFSKGEDLKPIHCVEDDGNLRFLSDIGTVEDPPALVVQAPAVAPVLVEPVASQEVTGTRPEGLTRPIGDLKEALQMLNDYVETIRKTGADVDLRIDESGRVRGKLQVTYTEEL